jgi:hypothetical protein
MSDLPDDRQIVRNEDIGQVLFILQPQQKIEDLSLYVDVQRGYRLVRDDELCCKRPRDRDPLALSSGELVWISPGGIEIETAQARRSDAFCLASRSSEARF